MWEDIKISPHWLSGLSCSQPLGTATLRTGHTFPGKLLLCTLTRVDKKATSLAESKASPCPSQQGVCWQDERFQAERWRHQLCLPLLLPPVPFAICTGGVVCEAAQVQLSELLALNPLYWHGMSGPVQDLLKSLLLEQSCAFSMDQNHLRFREISATSFWESREKSFFWVDFSQLLNLMTVWNW